MKLTWLFKFDCRHFSWFVMLLFCYLFKFSCLACFWIGL